MEKELEYCFLVIENAKKRGLKFCQVPIFGLDETINKLNEIGFKANRIGFEPSDPMSHIEIEWVN